MRCQPRHLLLLSLAVAAGAACQQPPAPAAESTPWSPGAPAGQRLDLSAVVAEARLAVRRGGDGLQARGDLHLLNVAPDGSARFSAGLPGAGRPVTLRLATASAQRGAADLLRPGAPRPDGRAVVVDRGALEERFQNGPGGVEQTWRLAAPPPGAGDLVVGVRAEGLALRAATAAGLHFGAAGGGPLVRYGAATLVDAAGRRTALAMRHDAGLIRITVPAAALASAAYPAVIDPFVGVEQAVDVPATGLPAAGPQVSPALACASATDCLVAWQDQVLGPEGLGTQLRGARVVPSASGPVTIKDPGGLDLDLADGGASDAGAPVVVATGAAGTAEYAVVYPLTVTLGPGLFVRRIQVLQVLSAAGGATVGAPVTASIDAQGNAAFPSAAAHGGEVLLAWSDIQNVKLATWKAGALTSGVLVPLQRPTDAGSPLPWWDRPAVAWTGTSWALAWRSSVPTGGTPAYFQSVALAFLDTAGAPLPGKVFDPVIGGSAAFGTIDFVGQPKIASDGAGTVLVSALKSNGAEPPPGDLLATRVAETSDASIPRFDGDWITWPLASPATGGTTTGWSTWWTGTQFAVAQGWSGTGGTHATVRLLPAGPFMASPAQAPAGLTAGTDLFPAGRVGDAPQLAPVPGGGALLARTDRSGLSADVRATTVTLPGTVADLAGALLTTGGADEDLPAVAFTGGTWLVAWQDQRGVFNGTAADVLAVRIPQAGGVPTDATPIVVSGASGAQGRPRVAGANGAFLVGWQEDRIGPANAGDVYVARVSAAGVVSDLTGLPVAATARAETLQDIAWDGTFFDVLVLSEAAAAADPAARLDVVPVSASGSVGLAVNLVTPASATARLSWGRLGCSGTSCLAAWSEEGSGSIAGAALQRPVGGSLAVGAPFPLLAGTVGIPQAAISCGPGGSLVAVRSPSAAVTNLAVRAVSLAGVPAAGFAGVDLAADIPDFAIAHDGFDHVIAWTDGGLGQRTLWLADDGSPRSTAWNSGLATRRRAIDLRGDGEGRTLSAWSQFDAAPGLRSRRVKVELATFAKLLGEACLQGTDCASGSCVEGVCCDGACGGGTDPCFTCNARNGHGTPGRCTAAAGDACNDGAVCTRADTCSAAGVCGGTSFSCTPTQCQQASTCNGTACTVTNKPNTATCDDLDPCTSGDTCTDGACAGTRYACTRTACQESATCDGLGGCTVVEKAEGATCDGGTCQAGACKPGLGQALGFSCGAGGGGAPALLLALLALLFRPARRSA